MAQSNTYVLTEVVGASDTSISDAIQSAITTASKSLRNLSWFEVVEVRGSISDKKVSEYQVTLKLGLPQCPAASGSMANDSSPCACRSAAVTASGVSPWAMMKPR